MKVKLNVGSLFAGVGGVCLGMKTAQNQKAEFNLVWANEIDEYACETYRTNFDHTLLEGDLNLILKPSLVLEKISELTMQLNSVTDESHKKIIKKSLAKLKTQYESKYYEKMHETILNDKIDLLNGGFPCQAFSIAGAQKGFEDDRGNLFLSIIELINQLGEKHGKPRFLFLENVKNLHSHDNGKTYKVIKNELEKAGYIIKEYVLNTMHYSDLPQNRERLYIIGFLNNSDSLKFDLFDKIDEFKVNKTPQDRINDIKSIISHTNVEDRKYYYTPDKYPRYFAPTRDMIRNKDTSIINLEQSINESFQFYQLRRSKYVRKNKSNVCPALTANMGTGGHNVPIILVSDGIRKLTPSEAFKLQGFPIGNGYTLPLNFNGKPYGDAHLYKQAGNSVSIPIIKMISEQILNII